MEATTHQCKVSVVIPVYGVERYISSAIESVLEQTYRNFELIIVDDGSCDRSLEICQQFTDPRIRIIQQANRGLSGARNTGIRHSTGKFVAFLDGDDCWRPQKLEYHVQHLNASPHVGVSFSFSEFIDENGNLSGSYIIAKTENIELEDFFHGNLVGNGSTPVFRKEALEDIRFEDDRHGIHEAFYYDEDLRRSEDHEIIIRLLIKTDWEIAGTPEALTLYRVNSGGLSANLDRQLQSWEQVLEKTYAYAPSLVDQWRDVAMAYHMRYLSRNAVRLKKGDQAFTLIQKSLSYHWKIILEEPYQTLGTLVASCILLIFPNKIYSHVESFIRKSSGLVQQRKIFHS